MDPIRRSPPRWALCFATSIFMAVAVPALAYEAFVRAGGARHLPPDLREVAVAAAFAIVLLLAFGWHLGSIAHRGLERRSGGIAAAWGIYGAALGALALGGVGALRLGDREAIYVATVSERAFAQVRSGAEYQWCGPDCILVWLLPSIEHRERGIGEMTSLSLNVVGRPDLVGDYPVQDALERAGEPLPGFSAAFFDTPDDDGPSGMVARGGQVRVERVAGRYVEGTFDVRFEPGPDDVEPWPAARVKGRFTAKLRLW